ncbi:urokinase plasminogen activator surface receptor-like isoform X2 [Misgurnus anguillicaudatus]|uniref:urokinase plasminogen activator surface receptor-like isoform X2 n=1 Tax=Misgurnus anguillicaudatus TaxID=75329 RepID=UPI003CCF1CB5
MELKIFIVLFCALFTGGHSLKCYECTGPVGSCANKETTCSSFFNVCSTQTTVTNTGGAEQKMQSKGCGVAEACMTASINFGVTRTVTSTQCCNTDLCNSKDASDSSSNSANGKQCYYCNGQSCTNKLNCIGSEDYCIKATVPGGSASQTLKGCASKFICDTSAQGNAGLTGSCCQGSLCNGAKSVTQNLLFLLWPLFFYILIH